MGANLLFYVADSTPPWPPELPWIETFTGPDGSQPSTTAWTLSGGNLYASIQNNKLNFDSPGNNANYHASFYGTLKLTGDFDIQLDFDVALITAPSDGVSYAAIMYVFRQSDNGLIGVVTRGRTSTGNNGYTSGGTNGTVQYARADSSGKLRITRVSNVVRTFMWSGSQWEWEGNAAGRVTDNSEAGDLFFLLQFEQENNSTVTSNIDNFTINSADGVSIR